MHHYQIIKSINVPTLTSNQMNITTKWTNTPICDNRCNRHRTGTKVASPRNVNVQVIRLKTKLISVR